MMNDRMPILSNAFTVDDIHSLREYNFQRRKGMTVSEINEDTCMGAEAFLRLVRDISPTEDTKKA